MRGAPWLAAVVGVSVFSACSPKDATWDASTQSAAWDAGADPCAVLVDTRCAEPDAGLDCWDMPACEAAQLVARHEPTTCATKLEDVQRYPVCGLSTRGMPCDNLADRCCGPHGECGDSAGCGNARAVAEGGGADACTQAMDDDTGFPPCSPPRG